VSLLRLAELAAVWGGGNAMSVYKVIRIIGSSPTSWEEAAKNAVEEASKHLHDMRIGDVEHLDMRLENGKVVEYRARMNVSFRYKGAAE
jgi:dodecin